MKRQGEHHVKHRLELWCNKPRNAWGVEAGRSKEGSSPTGFRVSMALPTP